MTTTPRVRSACLALSISLLPLACAPGGAAGGGGGGGGDDPPGGACAHPVFVTSDPNGGWEDRGYYVHNNMWNSASYPVTETLSACSFDDWYVVARADDRSGDGAVKTYPNVHKDYRGVRVGALPALTSRFAATTPHVGIYNVAYDVWLDGVAERGCTELMIWTENFHQVPGGSKVATATLGGRTYDVWRASWDWQYVAFVPRTPMTSGTLDVLELLRWMIGRGWITESTTLDQLCFGVEIVSTGGADATFRVTDFAIDTTAAAAPPVAGAPEDGVAAPRR